jgi:hypothetical protein
LVGAIAYIVLFGDKIAVTADGMLSLKDVAITAWDIIKEATAKVTKFMEDRWDDLHTFLTNTFGELPKDFETFGGMLWADCQRHD